MKRGERKCIVCGKVYYWCGSCPGSNPSETWRNLYCDESCREIFDIVSKYKNGTITAVEAQMKLKSPNIDLSNKDSFGEEYKDALDEILSSKKDNQKEIVKQDKLAEKKADEKRPIKKEKE